MRISDWSSDVCSSDLIYVRRKIEQCRKIGMRSLEHRYGADCTEAELLALIAQLNADPTVHGILVPLLLPKQIDSAKVLDAIDPAQDVDGFPDRKHVTWGKRVSVSVDLGGRRECQKNKK